MMDEPVIFLGKKHRILFHDPVSAIIIAETLYPNDKNAIAAANLHILTDQLCTADPSFKRMLENMEKINRKNKKKTRKKAPNKSDPVDKMFIDLEKMQKIERMCRYLSR